MVINRIESVPLLWDEERDGPFFRLVSRLFRPEVVYAAGVLLAGADRDARRGFDTAARP